MTKSRRSYRHERIRGKQEPSVKVVPKYADSDGDDADRMLRAGGLILDGWQTDILMDWMAITRRHKWVCRTCGGSIPRQNGKSFILQARAEAGMMMYNEQVIYTAHLQKTATETFEEMASFFDAPKVRNYVRDIKTALGREQIILRSGARVKFLARTRNGGRGQHGDLLIFDEAQELDEEAQASFIPAISASRNPQVIYTGTPPEPTSGVVFRGIRDRALKGETKNTAWFEYSVDEIGDVKDKKRWAKTNPALGERILETTVEGECEQLAPYSFARERLGWWTPPVDKDADIIAIDPEVWMACMSNEPKPEGKKAYGVKFSPDGAEVCLCAACIPEEGKARISLIDRRLTAYGLQWLADFLNGRYTDASCVVIDGRNGVDVLIEKIAGVWRLKGTVIRPGVKDIIAAVSVLTDALNERTVTWYEGQDDMKESGLTSIRRAIGSGWGFGGENSLPIEAASLALWGARTSKRDPSRKMRIV